MFNFFKRKKKDPLSELKTFLGGYELPSFSSAVINVLGKLRDPEASMGEIVPLIELDPGMTVKILRLVNSAGFGLTTKASNLQHAITLMGRSRLEAVVLSFGVSDSLPSTMECMERGVFWATSARRACLARIIAQHLHAATQAECFTVGLLMDMAIPVLDHAHRGEYGEVLARWHADDDSQLTEMESEAFGYDHAAIGALMAEAWDLPEYIVHSIAAHHMHGPDSQAEPAVQLVSLIKYFDQEDGLEKLVEAAQLDYAIDKPLIEEMIKQSFSYAEQFISSFR
ncbi:MAG: HDOD domain-containing protein [Desulfobulbaceae bacterium]|nr:HDOD domain-containing protein [Desulfobulbaceae bacterium]